MLDHTLEPKAVHRLEVITGTGRRRRFSEDDKARIMEETLVAGGGGFGGCASTRAVAAAAVRLAPASPAAFDDEYQC
jgi:hypothetical protein